MVKFDISTVRNTGRTHFKKGEVSKFKGKSHSVESKEKMSEDRKGKLNHDGKTCFKKGIVPWNKGKTGVYSEERLQQISEQTKARLAKHHPMNGKKHTPEAILKIKEARKNQKNLPSNKGKQWSDARREFQKQVTRKKKVKTKWTKKHKNMYHPLWNEIRKVVYKRDQYKCQECGVHCRDSKSKNTIHKIQCHHIDYDTTNNDLDNLITLCASCHCKTNYKRSDWIERYSK